MTTEHPLTPQEWYDRGERLWELTLSCGHTKRVSTVIGDFDYEAHHVDLPEFCMDCDGGKFPGKLVERVGVRQVPVAEW